MWYPTKVTIPATSEPVTTEEAKRRLHLISRMMIRISVCSLNPLEITLRNTATFASQSDRRDEVRRFL